MPIDLNCDMGEGFASESAVMPFITSANVACGAHAGDTATMGKTIRLAKLHGVAVGAHPGWPDLQGFGRREMAFPPEEAQTLVLKQLEALAAIAQAEGVKLRHVKAHGALYNQAVKELALAVALAGAVQSFDKDLIFVGLAGSMMIEAASVIGLRVASEGFPDRRYEADGTLMSRSKPGAVIEAPDEVAANAVRLAREGITFGGRRETIDTLCLHGDNPRAAENARQVRLALEKAGVEVRAL